MPKALTVADSIDIRMISHQIPKPLKRVQKLSSQAQCPVPDNETARLLILKQSQILDSDRDEVEFDRFTALAQRILQVPYAFLTFIDFERQWIKSDVGVSVENPNTDRSESIDAFAMFPDAPEVCYIPDIMNDEKYQYLKNPFGLDPSVTLRFYSGAVVSVDGFRVGVLSVVDTKPWPTMSFNDRQNLFDLAAAVSHLVRERRQKNLRFRKERANLMLGLNHNLRTPLMSLTLVTEMLRSEIKQLAIAKAALASGKLDELSSATQPMLLTSYLSSDSYHVDSQQHSHQGSRNLSRANSESSLADMLHSRGESGFLSYGTNSSIRRSQSTSRQHTPDIPCMNLLGDLQGSLQQLGLLVEMGLVLGKITSGMAVLSDGTYDSILCDVLKVFEKVQSLTQRLGRSQNVLWNIDRRKFLKGKQYSHPDVLMFVLISALTQLLPHSDLIKVKATFIPVEEVTRMVDNSDAARAIAAIADIISPTVVVGRVGLLMTELEIFGDSNNLKEIVSKLHLTSEQSDSSKSGANTSSVSDSSGENADPTPFIDPDVEEFGGSIFALGSLLENVLGGSSYVSKNHGCVFSFSIPMRIEHDHSVSPSKASFSGEANKSASNLLKSRSKYHLPLVPSMVGEFNAESGNDMKEGVNEERDSDNDDDAIVDVYDEDDDRKEIRPSKVKFQAEVATAVIDDIESPRSTRANSSSSPPTSARSGTSSSDDSDIVVYVKEAIITNIGSAVDTILPPIKGPAIEIIKTAELGVKKATDTTGSPSAESVHEPLKVSPLDMSAIPIPPPVSTKDLPIILNSSLKKSPSSGLKSPRSQAPAPVKCDIVMSLRDMITGDIPTRDRPLRVLLVDDSITVQKVMSIWLSKKNCVISKALNGQVALNLMKENAYDLVFMDFLMPVMDGLTCMRLYHEFIHTSPAQSLPVGHDHQWMIGLSATALAEDHQQAFEVNMHMFCSKPVDMTALSYVLEAKRCGLPFDTLRDIARDNRASKMSSEQRKDATTFMVPDSTNPQLSNDRDLMLLKLENNSNRNIFGSFTFNL